jgi:PAS domain S-box-containing protein
MLTGVNPRPHPMENTLESALENPGLLDSLQVGVAVVLDRKLGWANHRFFELLGYDGPDLTGLPIRTVFQSDDDYARIDALVHARFREGKPLATEMALRRKNGEPIWCHITGNPVDPGNPAKGYIWSCANISDRINAEQVAREIKDDLTRTLTKQEAIFRSLQVGVVLVKDRKVIWGNQRFFSTLGFEQEELINQSCRIYFWNDEDYASIERLGYPLLRAGKPFDIEIPIKRKDGRRLWCHIIGNAVNLNDLSEGFIWSFADITDRVLAETEMREARDRLDRTLSRHEAVLRSLQVGVLLAKDRKVAWANQRFFDMLGFSPEELIGQNTRVYFCSDEDYDSIRQHGYPLLCEGKPFATELPIQRRDGRQIWCHVTGNAVSLDNFEEGFIWSFADITDRINAEKRAREALEREQLMEGEKMSALGVVVAGVAHEINTPIGVSYTLVTHFRAKTRELVDAFKNGSMKKSDLQRYVELSDETSSQLEGNIARAAQLIQSFKQIAVDQTRDDRREFNLREYLQEIVTSLSPNLRKTSHRIAIECPQEIEMDSYAGALSQVMTNLIMNALIHAFDEKQAGRMKIAVRDAGERVAIDFSDDGKGIAPENLPKIFDPFFTTRRGAGGSGLGLNIVFNLVTQKLQGYIRCDSMPGEGALFQIDIPKAIQMET